MLEEVRSLRWSDPIRESREPSLTVQAESRRRTGHRDSNLAPLGQLDGVADEVNQNPARSQRVEAV